MWQWAEFFETADRVVKREDVGNVTVSTVFLSLDHSFGMGPPILWETMVFRGKEVMEAERCAGSREQAEAMHERIAKRLRSFLEAPVEG